MENEHSFIYSLEILTVMSKFFHDNQGLCDVVPSHRIPMNPV